MTALPAAELDQAIEAGAEALLSRQRPDGGFEDDPPGSVLGTGGAVAALAAVDPVANADLIEGGVRWLLEQQHADGGWGGVTGAESELVATAVALAALRLTATAGGSTAGARAIAAGRAWLSAAGGMDAVTDPALAVLCRQLLKLAGLDDLAGTVRRLPLEIVFSDRVRRQRISFRTAPFLGVALMQTDLLPARPGRGWTLRRARSTAVRLLRSIYDHEGRTGAMSEDPWLAALVLLGLVHSGEASDIAKAITRWLRRVVRPDGAWDAVANLDLTRSGYAATGLIAAGYAADERLDDTREFFHNRQKAKAFQVLDVPPGGWSYSNAAGWPVTLESAEILLALAGYPDEASDPVLRSGCQWLLGRQDKRGSWSRWVRNTQLTADGPCPAITSQAISALHAAGYPDEHPAITAAAGWLLTQQRPDGTFDNLWYRDYTSGTAVVLAALAKVGHRRHEVVQRAVDWLCQTQLPDGSWGPGTGSQAATEAASGSVEETSWAVLGLLAVGDSADARAAVDRGVGWLVAAAQPDGSWQPARVCNYLRHYLCYPNGVITQALALRALGEYRAATERTP